jgi:hypothetical protein
MTGALLFLAKHDGWPRREGDKLIVDDITYHPNGAIWLDGRD